MKRRPIIIISWATVMAILFIMTGCGSSKGGKQKIIVRAGNNNIFLSSDKRGFTAIMESHNLEDLPYIKNNQDILIEFNNEKPESIRVSEHILNKKGEPKFATEETGKNVDIKWNGAKAFFKTEPNIATLLSSDGNDYNKGAAIRGYHLTCDWGENDLELFFIIRSDSAVLNE